MRRELRRASARPAFKSSQVKQASKLRLISLLAQVKSSQGKARQVSTSFVASAPHAAPTPAAAGGCGTWQRARNAPAPGRLLRLRSVSRAGLGGSRSRSSPGLSGARGGWRAIRTISGTVTRWSLTTPRHTPHQKSVHHTQAGKSTDETPYNILRKLSRQGPCFLSLWRRGPSAPPLATVSETRAIHASVTPLRLSPRTFHTRPPQ
jgi:hypothetical protein